PCGPAYTREFPIVTKTVLLAVTLAGTLGLALPVFAADNNAGFPPGDAQAGQQKAASCAACHGADGNSASPQFPKLAGQSAAYLVHELKDFKSGKRQSAIMQGMAASLSEQDMKDVAAWYSSQTIKPGAASPDLVEK